MGATVKPDSDLFVDTESFAERTGMLSDWRELLPLGLEPDSVAGSFDRCRVALLQSFVGANPGYHIITFADPNGYVNKFVPGPNTLYHLADGDSNPDLICNPFLAPDWELVVEEAIGKSLAMLKDLKNRRQTKG